MRIKPTATGASKSGYIKRHGHSPGILSATGQR